MSDNWKAMGRTVVKDLDVKSKGVVETWESVELDDRCTRRFIIWRLNDHWMDWEVHETSGCAMDGTALFGEMTNFKPEPCADSLLIEGMLKWDSCCQWNDGGKGWHYDGLARVPDLRSIIEQLHSIAAENMQAWDS